MLRLTNIPYQLYEKGFEFFFYTSQRIQLLSFSFAVTSDMVSCFLEGVTLEEVIERKEIYISNLSQLEQVSCPEGRYVSMFLTCLFYTQRIHYFKIIGTFKRAQNKLQLLKDKYEISPIKLFLTTQAHNLSIFYHIRNVTFWDYSPLEQFLEQYH